MRVLKYLYFWKCIFFIIFFGYKMIFERVWSPPFPVLTPKWLCCWSRCRWKVKAFCWPGWLTEWRPHWHTVLRVSSSKYGEVRWRFDGNRLWYEIPLPNKITEQLNYRHEQNQGFRRFRRGCCGEGSGGKSENL